MKQEEFMSSFETIFNNYKDDLLRVISAKYNIPVKELLITIDGSVVTEETGRRDVPPPPTVPVQMIESGNNGLCAYAFQKGNKKGTVCGCVIKKANSSMCSKHQKYDSSVVVSTPATIVKSPSRSDDLCDSSVILRKNKKINMLWHSGTKMVFKSAENRVVFGKLVGDEIVNLTDEDITTCKQMGFHYKKMHTDEPDVVIPPPPIAEIPITDNSTDACENESGDDSKLPDTCSLVVDIENYLNNLQISPRGDIVEEY